MEERIEVSFPTDERGLTGRECPACKDYFKVKFGTGLATSACMCPYCGYVADHGEFFTKDQIEYAESVALREVLGPGLEKLDRSFKELERATRGGFIEIKVTTRGSSLRLKRYQERELETHAACDSCGLEFAIYGVFANCPDCRFGVRLENGICELAARHISGEIRMVLTFSSANWGDLELGPGSSHVVQGGPETEGR